MFGYSPIFKQDLSITNLIENGIFENGIDSWSVYGSGATGSSRQVTNEISKFGTYSLQLTRAFAQTLGYGLRKYHYPFIPGHVYYFGGYCYVPSGVTVTAIPRISVGITADIAFSVDTVDTWQRQSKIFVAEKSEDFILGTSSKSETEGMFYFDGIFLVDLTETFGVVNITEEEMDLLLDLLGGWWEGKLFLTQTQLTKWHLAIKELFLQNISSKLKPMVTFAFDDGYLSNYNKAFYYCQKKGIRATYFITSAGIDAEGQCSTAQLKEMAEAGHEIGSHTVNHLNLDNLAEAEIIAELKSSKLAIQTATGYPCKTLGIPNGQYNNYALQMLAGFYEAARSSDEGLNYYGDTSRTFCYKSYFLDSPNQNLASMKSLVDDAVRENAWLIISMHKIVETTPGDWQVLESDFQELVDYVCNYRPHQLDVVPFYEGACRIKTLPSPKYLYG